MDATTLNNLDIFETNRGYDASLSSLSKTYRVEEAEKEHKEVKVVHPKMLDG